MLVDDGWLCGTTQFQILAKATSRKFESRPREWDNVELGGLRLETNPGRVKEIHQPDHIAGIDFFPSDTTFEEFRSTRAALAQISHTSPHFACAANKATQITKHNFDEKKLKDLNACTMHIKRNHLSLKLKTLSVTTLQLRVNVDAAVASNLDFSSQLGFAILL